MSDVVLWDRFNNKPNEYNYHTWYRYTQKLSLIKTDMIHIQKLDSNNENIGITSIIQANNIAKAMDLYLEDNSNKDKLKEVIVCIILCTSN